MLIKAISEAKILDPACGSGAFPMGILHRLVDLLKKLDPNNVKWNQLQIERATAETAEVFKSGNITEREIRFNEINKAFDLSMNHPDYARKLFLIENCIYGVDIQQIAIQISKLRFFISLIVDQKVDDGKPNRNILSMPNLETKFVAANTLIGLDKPQQMTLMSGDVEPLEKELALIRHKIFFTRKYSAKKELKKQEKAKRGELKQALLHSGFGEVTATLMAGWNPFDPMQSAGFFDPETMFGLTKNEPVQGNIQSGEITVFNKQIEAINKQIEAINVAFQLEHEHEIIKLQLVSAHLQANIIEIELGRIQENINNLYGSIHTKVSNIANEPFDITYTVNALNKLIIGINKKIVEISLDIKPVTNQSNIGVFDIVIGNPPYVRRTELNSEMKKLFEKKYFSAYKQYDLYILFIERALELLKDQSTLCFINPIKFFSSDYGLNIRKIIVNENRLVSVLNVSQINVFENAMTYPCIINIKKGLGLETKIVYYNIHKIEEISFLEKLYPIVKYQDDIKKEADYKILFNENEMIDSIIEKIGKKNCTIKDFFSSHRGLANNKINFVSAKHSAIKPSFVKRYCISNETMYVDYCDTNVETTFSGVFSKDIIVLPRTVLSLQSAIKTKGEIILDRIYYLTPRKYVDLKIVMGFINSTLINFWFSCFYSSSKVQGGYFDLRGTQIETIPFIPIFDNYEKFSETVGQIISFKESNNQFDTNYLERLLDEMVYKLYELTYEEVKIVDPDFWLTEDEYGSL